MIRSNKHTPSRKEGLAAVLSLLVLGLSQAAAAQTSGNTNTNVSAAVVTGVSIVPTGGADGIGDIDFGLVSPNQTVSVNANSNASAGLYTVTGGPGSIMTVIFTSPSLTLSDGLGNQLSFTPQLVGAQLSTSQGTAASVANNSHVTLGGTGHYYLWLGGSITIPNGQAGGTYTGTFNLTVSY